MRRNNIVNSILGEEFKKSTKRIQTEFITKGFQKEFKRITKRFQKEFKRVLCKICVRMRCPPFFKIRRMMKKVGKNTFFTVFPPTLKMRIRNKRGVKNPNSNKYLRDLKVNSLFLKKFFNKYSKPSIRVTKLGRSA